MLAAFEFTTANIAIIGGLTVAAIAILAGAFSRSSRTRTLADLKERLVGKGMSADDIKKIVEAGEDLDD